MSAAINSRVRFDMYSLEDMRNEFKERKVSGVSWLALLAEECELGTITKEQRDHWAHASPDNWIQDRRQGPMKLTDEGLVINKVALEALLAFASADVKRPNLYGVHFLASESYVKARASNGQIGLDAVGPNETARPNEWFVHRDFLKGALKVLDNKSTLTLQFRGASLREAVVHNEDNVELAAFSWPGDAANFQVSFPEPGAWDRLLTPPKGKKTTSVTLNAEYLGLMSKVANAAGVAGIAVYPPPSKDERVVFRCEGDDTTWIAVVAPINTIESEADTDPVADAAGEFLDSVANLGGDTEVTMTAMDGTKTNLTKAAKARKARKGK